MSKINDGGPAFARHYSEDGGVGHWAQEGMSLRDYFAGQAVATCAAAWPAQMKAEHAYEIADAMLATRAKGGADGQ